MIANKYEIRSLGTGKNPSTFLLRGDYAPDNDHALPTEPGVGLGAHRPALVETRPSNPHLVTTTAVTVNI